MKLTYQKVKDVLADFVTNFGMFSRIAMERYGQRNVESYDEAIQLN